MNYNCVIMKYDMRRVINNVLLFCFFMIIPSVVGASCDYNEKNKLQALASNLGFSYNYTETDEGINSKANFSIIITNMRPEIYVVDQTNIKVYYYNNNEFTINGYKPGSTTQFIVYGNVGECKGVELLNNYITLPSYNRFYKDEVCEGVSDYKLCNRWTRVNLSHGEFVKKVEQYKLSLNVEVPPVVKEKNFVEKIIEFLSKYSIYLFGGIILICSGLIIYLRRKDDFDLG